MSIPRQILLSLVLIILAGGVWLAYERRDLVIAALGGTVGGGAAISGPGAETAGGAGRRVGVSGPAGGFAGGPSGGFAPVAVVTAPVEIDSVGTELRAIGTAAAVRSVTVYPQVTGIVSEVAFTPGGRVADDQVLLRLDAADQQVAVDRAKVAVDAARQAVERAQRLSKSGNVTAVALSDAETEQKKAEIDLKSAELELAKRIIHAPFAGTVGLTDLAVGDLVSSSKAITTVDDMSTVTVAFDVAENAVGKVAIGQAVGATTAALPGETLAGEISAVDSRIDPASRTLRVEARLPNDRNQLKPGMAVTVSLSIPGVPRPAVPSLAIQWDRQGSFVWKLDGDKVRRTPVQIIGRRSGTVTVAGDLGEGAQVVVEGTLKLREGTTVAPAEGSSGSAAPAAGDGGRPAPGSASAAGGRSG